jgi:diguanylate cyclase (GGDEF)-like protein
MPVDGIALSSLNELKYRHGFPPRQSAAQLKGSLASRGLGNSGVLAQQVAGLYLAVVEKVLDDFAERVFQHGAALGLPTPQAMRQGIVDAHRDLFDLTRRLVRNEVPGDYGNIAAATVDDRRIPVWQHLERKIELHTLAASPTQPTRELDPAFGILLSPRQLEIDFDARVAAARAFENPVTVLFLDLGDVTSSSARLTTANVDHTLASEAQRLVRKLIQGRGDAYLHGRDAMVILAPNLDEDEAKALAEKVRRTFEDHKFELDSEAVRVTIAVGVATWPTNGATYQAVLKAANRAQLDAKRTRNAVVIANGRNEEATR